MLEKIKRVTSWTITNSLLIVFGAYGMFLKIGWCENIFLFYIYLAFVMTLLCITNTKSKELIKERGWAVSKNLSIFVDLLMVTMLAAAGRFFTAIIWFIQMVMEISIHENEIEEVKEKKEK